MSNFEEQKRGLWEAALSKVRHDLDQMPEKDRPQLKEIADKHFPLLVSEILEAKEKFKASTDLPTAGHFSGRYAVLNRKLFRNVSLAILGVDIKDQPPNPR